MTLPDPLLGEPAPPLKLGDDLYFSDADASDPPKWMEKWNAATPFLVTLVILALLAAAVAGCSSKDQWDQAYYQYRWGQK